jgi:hypothetical protein
MARTLSFRSRCAAAVVAVAMGFAVTAVRAQEIAIGPQSGPCAREVTQTERAEGIPRHLLAAISLAESGRSDERAGETIAWPWTINAEGQGIFFATKAAAIAAVRRLQARGIRSIDVGCMQVNLLHHPEAFASLDEAFDPATNVAYAARFLKALRDEQRSWPQAVAHYHSATPDFGVPYRSKVYSLWAKVRHQAAEDKRREVIEAYLKREAARLAADAARLRPRDDPS